MQDLENMVKLCQKNNIKLIIQNYPYSYPSANTSLKNVALKYSLAFVNNRSVFKLLIAKDGEDKYFRNYDHCTAKGYKIMAKNVYKVLISECPEFSGSSVELPLPEIIQGQRKDI